MTTGCKGDDVQRYSVHPVPERCTTEAIFSNLKGIVWLQD